MGIDLIITSLMVSLLLLKRDKTQRNWRAAGRLKENSGCQKKNLGRQNRKKRNFSLLCHFIQGSASPVAFPVLARESLSRL